MDFCAFYFLQKINFSFFTIFSHFVAFHFPQMPIFVSAVNSPPIGGGNHGVVGRVSSPPSGLAKRGCVFVYPLHRLRRSPAPSITHEILQFRGARYAGMTKGRNPVFFIMLIIEKYAVYRFAKNAQTHTHRAIPQIKVVARKPRFFCKCFGAKTKIKKRRKSAKKFFSFL